MIESHKAEISWSSAQVDQGLPNLTETIDPAWLEAPGGTPTDGWSLVCTFDVPPSVQGNPSIAHIRFMVDHAPHERLRPGAVVYLFERGTARYAKVSILD